MCSESLWLRKEKEGASAHRHLYGISAENERACCLLFLLKLRLFKISFIAHTLKMNLWKFCSGYAFSFASFSVEDFYNFPSIPSPERFLSPSPSRFLYSVSSLNPLHLLLFFL